ncbi:hypothetical protein JRO89_XS05G0266800 [Xanthoceras sorbifolium]|uniref:GCF C-terminal domain-containing protein n=1 Tax=Xanthoceras sorbifolium TaxID=99658 RepID=A0ABQ8I3I5_9ROSI|nr:hypothetical protein JRO89_XS05G0266800 [Xanthoceras sorbifolium]
MSSSRTRNFRRRGDDDDDNNNDNTPSTTTAAAASTVKKPPPTSTSSKPKKLLSFADEEEDKNDTLSSNRSRSRPHSSSRLSKPSSSHKIISSKDRPPPPPHSSSTTSTFSNVLPQAGTYTKEALLELQKNTKTLAIPSSKPSSTAEPKIILKGLLKPVDSTPFQRKPPSEDSSDSDSDTEKRFASMGIGRLKDSSSIPDKAMIEAIRAKRERLRQSRGAAPDYISLDAGNDHHGTAEGLSDEEPEFPRRIAMFGEKVEKKKGVFEEEEDDDEGRPVVVVKDAKRRVEDVEYDDDEDEVAKMWEEEQVRKGLGKRIDDASARVVSSTSSANSIAMPQHQLQPQQKFLYPTTAAYSSPLPPPSIGGAMGGSQGLDTMSISQQAEIAMKALLDNANRLKESHGRTMSSLTKTDDDLSASLLSITALERSLAAAGEKFIFMQKLRDFVSVICEFLQHKASWIEELEEQMQKLHEERASTVLERRAADIDDEFMEVEAAVKAAMAVFSERGNSAAIIAAAKSAAQAASAAFREQTNLPVKLDEFGRDLNLQKRMDMTRRAEARQRRRARFDSKQLSSMDVDGSHHKMEGESSTDESDSESSAYQSRRESLLQIADQIFSDASEEYSQLSLVKERFEEWKRDYSSTYRDAYMSLSAPAIMSPYVRLELLKWDPLHEDADFSEMKWHSLLFNYGLPEDGKDFAADDADANLVPTLVEKVALPILHHEIAHCWDMLSIRETRNAVSATSLVITYVPTSSEALAELLLTIRTRLAEAVGSIMVPTWSPLVMNAVPNAARIAAYRFGMCVRLMRNICLWKEILASSVLEELALDELLCRKVLPHVRSITSNVHDAITRTERIVASLCGVWTGPNVTVGRSRKLQPLVDYMLSLGKTLEKKQLAGVSESESETGGLARRLKKMLVDLNEYDNARNIARTFHLKEAL